MRKLALVNEADAFSGAIKNDEAMERWQCEGEHGSWRYFPRDLQMQATFFGFEVELMMMMLAIALLYGCVKRLWGRRMRWGWYNYC